MAPSGLAVDLHDTNSSSCGEEVRIHTLGNHLEPSAELLSMVAPI